jgi:hypothetical protein
MENFKINYLPEKYENIILPLMCMNEKLVLGGSLALHILNIMDYDFTNRRPDLDMSLLSPLELQELEFIKDFFGLSYKKTPDDYENKDEKSSIRPKYPNLKKDLIQLYKVEPNEEAIPTISYVVDFFNSVLLPKKELVLIDYKGFKLRLVHPSVILSYKSKYAYDNRVGKQYKHFQDLQNIDFNKYFKIIKKMIAIRTEEGIITHYNYNPIEEDFVFDLL